ncbi:MAG: glycosyltransferase [Candidatus Krumholzibacteriota bacterium]|nr:glycosyltransferase [Candidatus Krumholzibacteriota bacterium]
MDGEKLERILSPEEWCGCPSGVLRDFIAFLRRWREENRHPAIVLGDEIHAAFRRFLKERPAGERRSIRDTLGRRVLRATEVIFRDGATCVVLREEPGLRRAFLVDEAANPGLQVELLDERRFLGLRESMVLDRPVPERFTFGVDFRPFAIIPAEGGEEADIGNGPLRVAEQVVQEIHADPQVMLSRLIALLVDRRAGDRPLFFYQRPETISALRRRLTRALDLLAVQPDGLEVDQIEADLTLLGFAPGWGRTAGRARKTLALLERLLLDPDAETLTALFQRLPLLRRVLLVSVHGWFAQANVLGRPDTGGQVVYLLDQARALEKHLRGVWREAGVEMNPDVIILSRLIPEAEGTTCNRPVEKIRGTENARILRVPFRDAAGAVHPRWLSRFQVWPYLERFAREAYSRVMEEMNGQAPDLVVGNYADGNLVASQLGREWNAPIAVVAHALEKTKYLLSDLYWKDLEADYHFSIHFLADILATSSADFIQTSSYQEIAGTRSDMGQYESYELFTLPGRYRVVSGVNIHSARFVINPPGTDTTVHHPYTRERRGDGETEAEIAKVVFGGDADGAVGSLADPDKPLLFTMARLDRIKNLTGLVQAYAKRPALRERASLLIVSGVTDRGASSDHEEREQIRRMHDLFRQHNLDGDLRWIPASLGQGKFPHYYRLVARRGGVFVQPALFEAFGLTVLEAMASGLPVVATKFGGPASIIEDGVSGVLYDPNRPRELEKAVLALLDGEGTDGGRLWNAVSHAGIRRVHERFSWPGHARRLALSHGLYGLWNHSFPERRKVRRTYVDALHHLLYHRLVEETWPELSDRS